VKPASNHGEYGRLVLRGTLLAGAGGLIAAGAILGYLLGGIPTDLYGRSLLAGGLFGGAVASAILWRCLVPRRGGFSIALAPVAGVFAVLLAHAAAWLCPFLVSFMVVGTDSLQEFLQSLGFIAVMAAFSFFLIGAVTLPVAVALATSVALWCRWRFDRMQAA